MSLDGLKVCFIAGTLGQGGAERQLFYLVKALRRGGAAVRLLTLTAGEYWESRIAELGAAVQWVGSSASRVRRLTRICAELRKDRPDVIQSQHFYANLYAVAAGRALGVREIGAVRGDVRMESRDTGGLMGRWSLRWPRLLACNSTAAIRGAIAMGVKAKRLALLRNAIDTDAFRPALAPASGVVRVLAVGRLVRAKRFDRFISVAARAAELTAVPFEAAIVGDGPCRERLEAHAATSRAAGIVRFLGAASDMIEVYRTGDVLACTSDHEGTPNAILEAMSCGLPVASTAVGSVPELVEEGETGYTSPPEDEEGLARKLALLIDDAALRRRMGANAREFVERNYSLERLPDTLAHLYEAALS